MYSARISSRYTKLNPVISSHIVSASAGAIIALLIVGLLGIPNNQCQENVDTVTACAIMLAVTGVFLYWMGF